MDMGTANAYCVLLILILIAIETPFLFTPEHHLVHRCNPNFGGVVA